MGASDDDTSAGMPGGGRSCRGCGAGTPTAMPFMPGGGVGAGNGVCGIGNPGGGMRTARTGACGIAAPSASFCRSSATSRAAPSWGEICLDLTIVSTRERIAAASGYASIRLLLIGNGTFTLWRTP
eukprot:364902-Chlamydomonas_euryale.AAC.13